MQLVLTIRIKFSILDAWQKKLPRILRNPLGYWKGKDMPKVEKFRFKKLDTIGAADAEEDAKEVIHKISMRSNQQNPIKRWNLVSNDDFQNDLARHFWAKHLYYERRQNEWRMRKMELQSIHINRGPELRWMVQLIASSHYNSRKLGPAVAQGQINLLFEEDSYAVIRSTSPEKAYQLFVLGEIMGSSLRRLRGSKRYIANHC